jgi:hypothetical protein
MSIPTHDWTKPLRLANRQADPSGVQGSGTDLQTMLLPGMSTVTPNIRYISIFTGCQYRRHEAFQRNNTLPPYKPFLRRLEALIALASVYHHGDAKDIPTNIIGRGFADSEITRELMRLDTSLVIPPYRIYRGTLGALGLFDLNKPNDPLVLERAKPIGETWNIESHHPIAMTLRDGALPETLSRDSLDAITGALCLCSVPEGSEEQRALTDLLFGLNISVAKPNFDDYSWALDGARVASWRLALDIIKCSPGRRLDNHNLMARILEPDVLNLTLPPTLHNALLLWRWVAARVLFERGWTSIFNLAFDVVRSARWGLSSSELIDGTRQRYVALFGKDKLKDVYDEVKKNCLSGNWIAQKFASATLRDCLLLMICGASISADDLQKTQMKGLRAIDSEKDIPFNTERNRIDKSLQEDRLAADYLAEVASEALRQHIRIALRKMAQGNPDTQHVDYEDGIWIVPPGRNSWDPRRATGFSRLDIAIGWLRQLGLVKGNAESYVLTMYGENVRNRWDGVYAAWA